ncbi:MAG: hypothetical protein ACE144_01190 [Thermodesulfobacteriota bacterium]
MMVYVVFRKDYLYKKGELLGVLVERRKDMRGKTPMESGLTWAKMAFRHLVKNIKDIYVFPKEMKVAKDEKLLVEKGVFTREEYINVLKKIQQEMN